MHITIASKILVLVVLACMLVGCSTSTINKAILLLDGFSAAVDGAAPFAGPYSPFVLLAAEVASGIASSLESSPAVTVTTWQGVLADLEKVANQIPNVSNAPESTKIKIQLIEAGLNALMAFVKNQVAVNSPAATGALSTHAKMKPKVLYTLNAKQLSDVLAAKAKADDAIRVLKNK